MEHPPPAMVQQDDPPPEQQDCAFMCVVHSQMRHVQSTDLNFILKLI
jgi:hypothetical protein